MAPAHNEAKIIAHALNFLAANFDSATEDAPVAYREEDVRELADKWAGHAKTKLFRITETSTFVVPADTEAEAEEIFLNGEPNDFFEAVTERETEEIENEP